MVKTFNEFQIKEGFDNLDVVITPIIINNKQIMIYYERLYNKFSFNYILKSFRNKDVELLMKTKNTSFRGIIFVSNKFTDFFAWDYIYPHHIVINYLQNVNYSLIYNNQLRKEIIDNFAMISFVFNKNHYTSDLFNFRILNKIQSIIDIKTILKLDDDDWNVFKTKNRFDNQIY